MPPDIKLPLAGGLLALTAAAGGAQAQGGDGCASAGELDYVCGVSVALPAGDEIWIGTFSGDRVGILPRP